MLTRKLKPGTQVVCVNDANQIGVDERTKLTKGELYTVREVVEAPGEPVGLRLKEMKMESGYNDFGERAYRADRFGCLTSRLAMSEANWLRRIVRLIFSWFDFYLVSGKRVRSENDKINFALNKLHRSTDEWAAFHSAQQALSWAVDPKSSAPPYRHVIKFLYPEKFKNSDIPSD